MLIILHSILMSPNHTDPAIGNFSEEIAHVGKPQDSNSIEYPLHDEVTPYKKTDRNRNLTPQSE